jgi:hypothetical protein
MMNKNKLNGHVMSIGKTQVISDKFQKREMILNTGANFNNLVQIQFTQDNTNLLDSVKIGEFVEIDINVGGREWTNPNTGEIKYFVTIDGWRIAIQNESTPNKPEMMSEPAKKPSKPKTQPETLVMDDDDDLPF